MKVHVLHRVDDLQLFFRASGRGKVLATASENLKDGQTAMILLTRYVRGFGLLFQTRTRFINESSSGLQRIYDTSHISESRPIQHDGGCASGRLVSFLERWRKIRKSLSGPSISPIRPRCQTLRFYVMT